MGNAGRRMTTTCCSQPKVWAIYLTSYTKSRTPILVCREFVRRHPEEFEVVDAAAVDAALGRVG